MAMRRLREEHGVSLTYQQLWLRIQDGSVPAERRADGRTWAINSTDLPAIARLFGRTSQPRPAA
jgi:hypothetical protein